MSGSAIPPGVGQIIAVLQNLVQATYAGVPDKQRALSRAPVYSASMLPPVAPTDMGQIAFVANARNQGEGAGSGTGCLCVVNRDGVWVAVYNGNPPSV